VAVEPDAEVICAAEVSTATSGDAVVAPTLLGDLASDNDDQAAQAVVYGDSAYGTGTHLAWLDQQGFTPMVKTQVPTAPGGRFAKGQFRIDLAAGTVTCPARVTVAIRPARRGGGRARFGVACSVCPLRQGCTSSVRGRVVAVHPHEAELAAARARQRDPAWLADYRATRPKVERKLAHLLRRRHGGRRARVRGWCAWPRTSSCWPPRLTWRGSPASGCAPPAPAGRSSPPDGGDQLPGTCPATATSTRRTPTTRQRTPAT
jgi:Transposase DDE domain